MRGQPSSCATACEHKIPLTQLQKRKGDEQNKLLTLPRNLFLPHHFEEQGKVICATGHFIPPLFISSLHLLKNLYNTQTPGIIIIKKLSQWEQKELITN